MVATRRSLGGQPSPASSSPPTTAPGQLSKAQQAALKKLQIVGTDALKGDPKAAQAAKEQVQTYHYRGAVYAADANTHSSWIENQPKRYLKRGAAVGNGEEENEDDDDDDDTPARRPTKRRRSMPQESRSRRPAAQTETSKRGKLRPGRAVRQSLPAKRNASALCGYDYDDDGDDDEECKPVINNTMHQTVPRDEDDRLPRSQRRNWLRESSVEREDRPIRRANATPTMRTPAQNAQIMANAFARRKQDAMRQNYQVRPLERKEMLSREDIERAKVIKFARYQKLLAEKAQEFKMAKELLDYKRRENGLTRITVEGPSVAPQEPQKHSYEPVVNVDGPDSSDDDNDDAREVDKQWEREQEQNRAANKDQHDAEVPETSPVEEQPTNLDETPLPFPNPYEAPPTTAPHIYQPQLISDLHTLPGASNLDFPLDPDHDTIATGANALPSAPTRGYTPSLAPPSRFGTESMASFDTAELANFRSIPPDGALPEVSKGGNILRWTIKRRLSIEQSGAGRAEYAIDLARLEGESKTARARRIKRERAVVESWASVTGGRIVEEGGGRRH